MEHTNHEFQRINERIQSKTNRIWNYLLRDEVAYNRGIDAIKVLDVFSIELCDALLEHIGELQLLVSTTKATSNYVY